MQIGKLKNQFLIRVVMVAIFVECVQPSPYVQFGNQNYGIQNTGVNYGSVYHNVYNGIASVVRSRYNYQCQTPCVEKEGKYSCHTAEVGSDYCSPIGKDYRGIRCRAGSSCRTHKTNDYTWCYTGETDWGYCSRYDGDTDTTIGAGGAHQDYYGNACLNKCERDDDTKYRCSIQVQGTYGNCSPREGATINGVDCRDSCGKKNEKYFWCFTDGSNWDYCGHVRN